MSRLLLVVLIAATLAACSEAGPKGYGYAANERPSLRQLGLVTGDAGNPFRSAAPVEQAADAE